LTTATRFRYRMDCADAGRGAEATAAMTLSVGRTT
jgi:hypothetical protein